MKMANVLITGGAGFIASHIAEACVRRGDRVRVLDDLSMDSAKLAEIAEHIEFVRGDVVDESITAR